MMINTTALAEQLRARERNDTSRIAGKLWQVVRKAKQSWLSSEDVILLLENYEQAELSLTTTKINLPKSGSLFVFDKRITRRWRMDGYKWKTKKNQKSLQESHEILKINGVGVVNCLYAHSVGDRVCHRRAYWLLRERNIVLVHYMKLEKPTVLPKTLDLDVESIEKSVNAEKNLRNMILSIQQQKKKSEDVELSLRIMELEATIFRKQLSLIALYIDQLKTSLEPSEEMRLLLWMMNQSSEFFCNRQGFWYGLMEKELEIAPEQSSLLFSEAACGARDIMNSFGRLSSIFQESERALLLTE